MDNFSYRIILFVFIFNGLHAQNPSPEVLQLSIFAPQLAAEKNIRVLLPENYRESGVPHAVIYMHDAQNLFDASTAYAGEWEVDETLKRLSSDHIVVGIDHGNEKRIDELTPYKNEAYGGGRGGAYANFIVNTLKPVIDERFNTYGDRKNTLIAGSSLGGLISHYMLLTYPKTFGGAILFSPSYWFSEKIFDLTKKANTTDQPKIYLATGALEPGATVPNHQKMVSLLQELGYAPENLKAVIREGAEHNEAFWRSEFPKAMEWFDDHQ